jgi:polar amino acid transport system substrate-binding protein/arginine/ornithine transport system substrate-binding protein
MKLRRLIHVFIAGTLLLAGSTVYAGDALRVGVEGAYPPFSWKESDGTLKGFDIDFAHEVCKRLGRECVLVEQEWDGMIPALLAKKFDTIIASMSITLPSSTTTHLRSWLPKRIRGLKALLRG